jgi:hypothetical protein
MKFPFLNFTKNLISFDIKNCRYTNELAENMMDVVEFPNLRYLGMRNLNLNNLTG